jgi:hypothetical protein
MTKTKAAAPVAEVETVEAPVAEAAAEVVAEFGDLTVLSNNTSILIDNTDVVEDALFQPGEIAKEVEINGFTVIEYK